MTTINNKIKNEFESFTPYDLFIKSLEEMNLSAPDNAKESIDIAIAYFKIKAAEYLANKN
jgi:hypothetical protein